MLPHPKWSDSRTTANLAPRKRPVELIVIHHSGGHEAGDLRVLCGETKRKVSCDFYVTEEGVIYKLNPQLGRFYTYHAGLSKWNGKWDVNKVSWGIECEHASLKSPWPKAQLYALARLVAWSLDYNGLSLDDHPIQGHASVAWPKGRKIDPWRFPWNEFGSMVRGIIRA